MLGTYKMGESAGMHWRLLPSPLADEHISDYVRRAMDHGLASDLGAELGLLGAYRDLSEPERKIFVAELIHRYVRALGPIALAKLASRYEGGTCMVA
jgi:hypothetical protein